MIEGIKTTIPLHQILIGNEDFVNGNYNINWLEAFLSDHEG